MYNRGKWGNLRKVSLDVNLNSYLGAAAQKQQLETLKTQRKNWKTGKIWQEPRMDQNFGCVNNEYFVLEDAKTTRSAAVYCFQFPNTPRMFGQ